MSDDRAPVGVFGAYLAAVRLVFAIRAAYLRQHALAQSSPQLAEAPSLPDESPLSQADRRDAVAKLVAALQGAGLVLETSK